MLTRERSLALLGLAFLYLLSGRPDALAKPCVYRAANRCFPRVIVRGPARYLSSIRLLPAIPKEWLGSTEQSGEVAFPGLPPGSYDAHIFGLTEHRPDTGEKLKDSLGYTIGDFRECTVEKRWLVRYGDCRDSLVVVLRGGEWARITTQSSTTREAIRAGARSSRPGGARRQTPDSVGEAIPDQ